mmetsp:Transcript_15088/g.23577  ORF Transcript_15088/g.23577 Transcript_15088/m.23577 type:complete len:83 (+) Transcript_15088:1649-1897(+)
MKKPPSTPPRAGPRHVGSIETGGEGGGGCRWRPLQLVGLAAAYIDSSFLPLVGNEGAVLGQLCRLATFFSQTFQGYFPGVHL